MLRQAILFGWTMMMGLGLYAQPATMYVDGNTLYDKCGNAVLLHGVNYPVLDDWNFPATSEVSAQIAQSGANSVRIPWYMDYGQPNRPAYALKDLDTVISRVARLNMIPILDIHDYTCQTGMAELNANIVPWLTQPAMLQLIEKHKAYLIINLANEYGYVNWTGNVPAAQTQFQNAYVTAVTALRGAGIQVPFMIDAPDCGTSSNRLLDVASAIRAADPAGDVIFSVHAYWYAYANNDSLSMRNYLQQMAGSGFCFVLGEVANYQDDGSYCTYALNYTAILHSAVDLNLGWMVWAWYKDGCESRRMSSDGNFANLTPFGQSVIHNPDFGLMHVAQKSPYLLNDGCGPMSVENTQTDAVSVFPNPANEYIHIQGTEASPVLYTLVDISGRTVYTQQGSGTSVTLSVQGLPQGWYVLTRNGMPLKKVGISR